MYRGKCGRGRGDGRDRPQGGERQEIAENETEFLSFFFPVHISGEGYFIPFLL